MSAIPNLDVELTACDLEPITRLERIQSFGFLVAVSSDWIVLRASANLEAFIGVDAHAALGMTLDLLVDPEALHDIRNRLTGLFGSGGTERMYGVELIVGLPRLDLAVHYSGKLCVLEGELAGPDNRVDAASLVRKMLVRLGKVTSLAAFHGEAARQIRAMTGFDRVLIYRFTESGAGEVIAESIAPVGVSSFLGLHFPAGDIPVQARALYLLNPFRIIADVSAATVPLLATHDAGSSPLDLTLAITRAVSPIHIEYLRNMAVDSSLSISIIIDGALWGLIACHNGSPRLPTFVVRTAAELFGQMYSMKLEARVRHAQDLDERSTRTAVQDLLRVVKQDGTLLMRADWLHDALQPLIPCDGVAVSFDGHVSLNGMTPAAPDLVSLAQLADTWADDTVFATDHIAACKGGSGIRPSQAAGMLLIAMSRKPNEHLMLFRQERPHEIRWGGDPSKPDPPNGAAASLTPRKSFEAYTQSVRGRSLPFTETERKTAEALRSGLVQAIRRDTPLVDPDHQRATERQELLIAELNHRVRNVLALIRGLISQTNGEGGDATSYVKSLHGRVQALARAHDRVTRQNWGPGPLKAIFEDEISAYVPTRRDRFTITGPPIFLLPQAFSTFALIIHELVTNSSKYGSLSDNGRVEVTLERTAGLGLNFHWREFDGPPVAIPTRRGFGSVIIERVVPFDLQGTASVNYLPAGLQAEFFIPERHIAPTPEGGYDELPRPTTLSFASRTRLEPDARPLAGMKVLLLEDNLIVALEAEDLLTSLGAPTVLTASTISDAANILDSACVEFAVLDINLGFETSLEFGERLRRSAVPFIFTSGYGETINAGGANSVTLMVSKPYDREQLGLAISRTLADPL